MLIFTGSYELFRYVAFTRSALTTKRIIWPPFIYAVIQILCRVRVARCFATVQLIKMCSLKIWVNFYIYQKIYFLTFYKTNFQTNAVHSIQDTRS